jgi:hypothetical protein
MKHETGKLHLTKQIPSLLINDKKVKNPEVIAASFNTIFLTVTENVNLNQEVRADVISFLKEAFPKKFPCIKTIPTTEADKNIIHSVKAKNSCGYEGIISQTLKICPSLICHPLTLICNHSFRGFLPDRHKISVVKPLYKKGDKTSMSNYSPISALTTLSKVLKKVIYTS